VQELYNKRLLSISQCAASVGQSCSQRRTLKGLFRCRVYRQPCSKFTAQLIVLLTGLYLLLAGNHVLHRCFSSSGTSGARNRNGEVPQATALSRESEIIRIDYENYLVNVFTLIDLTEQFRIIIDIFFILNKHFTLLRLFLSCSINSE